MKYLCSACDRLVEPTAAHLVGDTVALVCPQCSHRDGVDLIRTDPPLSTPTAEETPSATNSTDEGTAGTGMGSPDPARPKSVATEEPRCPKCHHQRPTGTACPRCGLIGDNWRRDNPEIPADVEAQWQAVVEHWADEEAHQRLLQLCLHYQQFEEIARRYRDRSTQGDQMAQQQLEQLANLGVQALRKAEPPSRFTVRTGRIVGWALFIALILGTVALGALLSLR